MRRPKLGPKAKADRVRDSSKTSKRKKRAEARFQSRGRDSSGTESDESPCTPSHPDSPYPSSYVDREISRPADQETPKPPRRKERKVEARTYLNRKLFEAEGTRENLDNSSWSFSDKDDSEFGTESSLSECDPQTDEELAIEEDEENCGKDRASETDGTEESFEDDESTSESSEGIDDLIANPFLYPPSQPIKYDTAPDVNQDPDMELFRAITAVKVRHEVSDAAIDDLIKVLASRKETFMRLIEEKKIGGSYRKNIKQKVMKGVPKITCGVLVEDASTNPPTCTYSGGLSTVPAELWKARIEGNRRLLRQDAMTTVAEVKEFHKRVCISRGRSEEQFLNDCKHVDLSTDGVQEAKHGKRKFIFVLIRFGRRYIYVLKVFNPLMKNTHANPNPDTMIGDIIDEIKNDEDLQLCYVIADTPERHLLKGMVSHAGRFSCESCTAEATTKPGLHWPLETMKGALRQEETMKEATRNLDDPDFDHRGITADSPLYDVGDHFSVIWNVPTEEFHLTKEGITKTIIKRLFEDSNTEMSREIFAQWTDSYERMRVFSETARRTRRIATGSMKGSEFGVILFSAFPALVSLLEEYPYGHWVHAKITIALVTFLCKAYNLDNEKLAVLRRVLRMTGSSLRAIHNLFYRKFTKGLCKAKGHRQTSNVHAFFHLHQMRLKSGAPLHRTSAEPFEALYAVVRRGFKVGTRNTPLQAMQNGYLRILHTSFHGREKKLTIKETRDNVSIRDSMVATSEGMFEVFGEESHPWTAHPIKVLPFNPKIGIDLPWGLIGIHIYDGLDYSKVVQIQEEEVTGKVMMCGGILSTWKREMLMSKVDD